MTLKKKKTPVKKTSAGKAEKNIRKSRKKNKDEAILLVQSAIKGMEEKKAEGILSMDMRDIKNTVTDFFVICHGNSRPHIEAIAKSVEEIIYKDLKTDTWHKEGFENAEWILLDYVTVVIHIFQEDKRKFYGIEKLWADAKIEKIA